MTTALPDPNLPMTDLLRDYPSARRALFAAYHIGGCQSCAFAETDTLAKVCQQHELDLEAVCETIAESREREQELLLSPQIVAQKLASPTPPILVDARTREEHEAVKIKDSILLTESTLSNLSTQKTEQEIVLYDHQGKSVLEHVSWYRGHGLEKTFALAGGIDAYSQEVDSTIPRYRLELD